LYDGLLQVFKDIREQFDIYEDTAKSCSANLTKDYVEASSRKRKRKAQGDGGPCEETVLSARDTFKTHIFYVLLDKLTVEMKHRRAAYDGICRKFSFLTDTKMTATEVKHKAKDLLTITTKI
jgi:hypothetical protein